MTRMRCASASLMRSSTWRVEHQSRGRVRSVANHCGLGQVDDASRRPTRRAVEVQSSAAVGPSAQRCARDASGMSHDDTWLRDRDRLRRGARCVPRASPSDDRDPGEPSTSASGSVSEAAERGSNEDNSLDARIWALALPAVASLLLDPVLGAVDTAFVGRLEGEGAAAALGGLAVSTTVFNFSFKLFNFLAVVTGPLVASQIAAATAKNATTPEARDVAEMETEATDTRVRVGRAAAAETVRGAVALAVALGVSATLALELGADGVLAWAGGNGEGTAAFALGPGGGGTGQAPTVLGEAEAYLRVRALSAPAALVGTVSVGAFRGLLDTKTPLLVSAGANLVNLALDPILIFGFGPVPAFGVAGAAAATTAAEWIAAAAFWALLVDEGLLPRARVRAPAGETEKRRRDAADAAGSDSGVDGASFLVPTPPSGVRGWAKALKPLAAGSASQLARTLVLQAVLVRATAEAAGAGAAGAHQICIQVWWVTLFALDALAVAAQSLVAASLGAGDVPSARRAADRSLAWAIAAGTAVGVGLLAAGPAVPGLFTDDADLARAATPSLVSVALLQPLNAAVFVGDGVLQGAADFEYLAVAMAAAAAPAFVSLGAVGGATAADVAAGAGAAATSAAALEGVWRSMALLQLGRGATLSWRYWGKDGPVAVAVGEGEKEKAEEKEKEA